MKLGVVEEGINVNRFRCSSVLFICLFDCLTIHRKPEISQSGFSPGKALNKEAFPFPNLVLISNIVRRETTLSKMSCVQCTTLQKHPPRLLSGLFISKLLTNSHCLQIVVPVGRQHGAKAQLIPVITLHLPAPIGSKCIVCFPYLYLPEPNVWGGHGTTGERDFILSLLLSFAGG